MRGVLGAVAGQHACGEDSRAGAEGSRAVRGPGVGVRAGGAGLPDASCSIWGFLCWASVTGCRRWSRRSAGKVEGAESGEFGRAELTLRNAGGRLLARAAGGAELLDEPPRLGLRAAAGVHRPGRDAGLAGRRLRGARPRPLRDPVPPRGRPHALRHRGADPLPARDRRLRGAVVGRVGDRRAGRGDPRPGRRRAGDLRPLRRRRLLGRGAARPPGDRRAADLRLRRPRADAAERGRAGGRGLQPVRHPAGPRRRGGALPRQARRGRRAGAQAQDHRRASSSASSRRRRRSSRTPPISSRERSTRT